VSKLGCLGCDWEGIFPRPTWLVSSSFVGLLVPLSLCSYLSNKKIWLRERTFFHPPKMDTTTIPPPPHPQKAAGHRPVSGSPLFRTSPPTTQGLPITLDGRPYSRPTGPFPPAPQGNFDSLGVNVTLNRETSLPDPSLPSSPPSSLTRLPTVVLRKASCRRGRLFPPLLPSNRFSGRQCHGPDHHFFLLEHGVPVVTLSPLFFGPGGLFDMCSPTGSVPPFVFVSPALRDPPQRPPSRSPTLPEIHFLTPRVPHPVKFTNASIR